MTVVGTVGEHALLPAVAAAAVGQVQGKDISNVVEALKGYTPPLGRMHLLRGVKNSLVVDDTYNSSPAAVAAGLETLRAVKGRTIVVSGDTSRAWGTHSIEEHKKVGAQAAKVADILFTVGFRAWVSLTERWIVGWLRERFFNTKMQTRRAMSPTIF